MARQFAINRFLLLLGAVHAVQAVEPQPRDRLLVPPVQGAYLGWHLNVTANPWGISNSNLIGWREELYSGQSDLTAYNFIGMELLTDLRPHELQAGARMILQPASCFTTSLLYERILYPGGLLSFQGGDKNWSEEQIWSKYHWTVSANGDRFTLRSSLQKEYGPIQGKAQLDWARIDLDDKRDSLYLFSDDILASSTDDIIRISGWLGYRIERPRLSNIGVSWYYITNKGDLSISGISDRGKVARSGNTSRQRAGIWFQTWPFSRSSEGVLKYWNLRTNFDLWVDHSSKQWEPRVELSIGWERNLLQPLQ